MLKIYSLVALFESTYWSFTFRRNKKSSISQQDIIVQMISGQCDFDDEENDDHDDDDDEEEEVAEEDWHN